MMCNLFVCQLPGVLKTKNSRSWMERFVHLLMSNVSYFLLAHASKNVSIQGQEYLSFLFAFKFSNTQAQDVHSRDGFSL